MIPAISPEQTLPEEVVRYGLFERGGQLFGIEVATLQEVISGPELTLVPRAPRCLPGVFNLRGEVMPLLIVDAWLGLSTVAYTRARPVLVLRGHGIAAGLQVDAMKKVLAIPQAAIASNPAASRFPHFAGAACEEGGKLITLLDGGELLSCIREEAAFAT